MTNDQFRKILIAIRCRCDEHRTPFDLRVAKVTLEVDNALEVLRQECERQWRNAAMNKDFGDLAYKKAAENITNLQEFVRTINSSSDQKVIAEIQARINVENARLQNEQIKLSTIAKMEESERQLKTERVYNGFSAGMANFSRPNF